MSVKEKKVYDYDEGKVRDRLVDVFRKRSGEATTADLIALTGLPKTQVEAEVKAVGDEYGARLRVTESGEILYSFPEGMKSRYRGFGPSMRRYWKAFKKGAAISTVAADTSTFGVSLRCRLSWACGVQKSPTPTALSRIGSGALITVDKSNPEPGSPSTYTWLGVLNVVRAKSP